MLRTIQVAMFLLFLACNTSPDPQPAEPQQFQTTDFALTSDMRALWTGDALWTRVLILESADALPDLQTTTMRAHQHQMDIANIFRPFYGNLAADELADLLHDHVNQLLTLLAALRDRDTDRITAAQTVWYRNADNLAVALNGLNPAWKLPAMRQMWRAKLDTTLAEANAWLLGNWSVETKTYDIAVGHSLAMANVLSAGLQKQRPEQVGKSNLDAGEQTLRSEMRNLWQESVVRMRIYMIAAIAGLPETDYALMHWQQSQAAIGDAMRPYYGNVAADQLTTLLQGHVAGAAAVVTTVKHGISPAFETAKMDWHANADQLAQQLAKTTGVAETDLKEILHTHLDQSVDAAIARVRGNWSGDMLVYDALVLHILNLADVLAVATNGKVAPTEDGIGVARPGM